MRVDKLVEYAQSLGGDVNFLTLKDGPNTVRFVSNGEDVPWRDCYKHFLFKYVEDPSLKGPICLGSYDACPGCQLVEKLRQAGDEKAADMARATHRWLFVVISRDNPFNDSGAKCLKILEIPQSIFQGLGKVGREWGIDFTDPDKGFDIEIIRTPGSGGGWTKYEVRAKTTQQGTTRTIVQTPLTEEERALVTETYPDLDDQIRIPDAVRLAAALGMAVPEPKVIPPRETLRGIGPAPESLVTPTSKAGAVPLQKVGARPEQPPPTPSADVTLVANARATCPQFEHGFDSEDESCRECSVAEACRKGTEAALGAPRRKSV